MGAVGDGLLATGCSTGLRWGAWPGPAAAWGGAAAAAASDDAEAADVDSWNSLSFSKIQDFPNSFTRICIRLL